MQHPSPVRPEEPPRTPLRPRQRSSRVDSRGNVLGGGDTHAGSGTAKVCSGGYEVAREHPSSPGRWLPLRAAVPAGIGAAGRIVAGVSGRIVACRGLRCLPSSGNRGNCPLRLIASTTTPRGTAGRGELSGSRGPRAQEREQKRCERSPPPSPACLSRRRTAEAPLLPGGRGERGWRGAQTRCGAARNREEQKKVVQTRFKVAAGFHSSLWIK